MTSFNRKRKSFEVYDLNYIIVFMVINHLIKRLNKKKDCCINWDWKDIYTIVDIELKL